MWIRPVGYDVPPGGIVLAAGETVRPAHLALLAQVGTRPEDAHVRRRPRVGVLSTGNNVAVGTDDAAGARRRGRIPNAHRPLLLAQLASYDTCVPVNLGVVADDTGHAAIARRLQEEHPAGGIGAPSPVPDGRNPPALDGAWPAAYRRRGCVGHVRPTRPAPSSSSSHRRFSCSSPSSHRAFIPASTSRRGAPASVGFPPAPCHPNPSVYLAKNLLLLFFLLPRALDHQAQGGGLLVFIDNRGREGGACTLLHPPPSPPA